MTTTTHATASDAQSRAIPATASPCHAPNGTYACQRLTGHRGPHRARHTIAHTPYLSRWEHPLGPVRTIIDRP